MWRTPKNVFVRTASFACLVCVTLVPSLALASTNVHGEDPRDTLVVNGSRVAYEAQVAVYTLVALSVDGLVDWWFGAGTDLTWLQSFEEMNVPLAALGTTRPFFRLERRHSGRRGRWGVHCTYHQPWKLSESDISPIVKGWVVDNNDQTLSSTGLRQVVSRPDDLFDERDTLLAPISAGHALRIGGSWERVSSASWHLWLAGSMTVLRPVSWHLSSPLDSTTWPSTQATDTYDKSGWLAHRFRLEVGALADVGVSHRGRRSASQLRISLFADSAKSWGARVMLLVSPTRR